MPSMADLDLFDSRTGGNATLLVTCPWPYSTERIQGLSPTIIGERCPLLMYAFDDGPDGCPQAGIEATSAESVNIFLRYLYTGGYPSPDDTERPSSLLNHAEVYKMAMDFDVPELKVLVNYSFTRETEFACSTPDKPIDLCEAIRFVYEHLPGEQDIIDTLLNYCVSNFAYHRLGSLPAFRQMAYENPEFHRGLIQTNLKHGFEDDGRCSFSYR